MSEQELAAKMDAALAHVDPDRRKFLGILLAGVAAAPLLTSASLAAEDKAHFPKTEASQKAEHFPKNQMKSQSNMKAQTWTKGGSTVNDDKHSNIKAQDVKGGQSNTLKNNSTLKNSSGANTQLKFDGVNNNKANTGTIKSSSGATKLDANANSNKIK
jgi:hypothetical protein